MGPLTFAVLAILLVGSALTVVLHPNPVKSAMALVATLFLLAVVFVFLEAHMIAALQVIVYAGAIMVLFLFVIMLLNLGRAGPSDRKGWLAWAVAVVLGAGLLVPLARLARAGGGPPAAIQLPEGAMAQLQQQQGMVGAVARPLFETYLVPFEITSLLLLAAIVGAVVLAKRKL